MTFQQELSSWFSPSGTTTASSAPKPGDRAPSSGPELELEANKPTILAFLRHCGCPFAEKTFLNLRESAHRNPSITYIAVSHSSREATNTWLASLPQAGSEPSNLRVVVDAEMNIYAKWGLGVSGWAHVLDPRSLYAAVTLGRKEGIWNRPTESGSRWMTSGTYAIDGAGVVRWGGPAWRADEIPVFEEAVRALEAGGTGEKETAKL